MDLFEFNESENTKSDRPLAEQIRPNKVESFIGQSHLFKTGSLLNLHFSKKLRLPNLIFWGPPGTGKTSLARILADQGDYYWEPVSAIDTGAKKLREIGEQARLRKLSSHQSTLLFIDEIHRLNKAQQDVLLPYSERGDFTLLGATTENPGYEMNRALLSRCQVLRFLPLENKDLHLLLQRAIEKAGQKTNDIITIEAQERLVNWATGDGRRIVQLAELVSQISQHPSANLPLQPDDIDEELKRNFVAHDKSSDLHYDCISAFIKSLRGSDPDAAIYYLARMLAAGEDPLFIARRMIILASEDIGNAEPMALVIANAAFESVEKIGLPEAAINLAQAVTYLASAPKSNRSYKALREAQAVVRETGELEIPLSLRSAQTDFAKSQGYGRGYRYSHDYENAYIEQQFLPAKIKARKFYEPSELGQEKEIKTWLNKIKNRK